jgi:hypothetical protein
MFIVASNFIVLWKENGCRVIIVNHQWLCYRIYNLELCGEFFNHFTCEVPSNHAVYYAFIMDDATIIYLVLFYDIAPLASIKT